MSRFRFLLCSAVAVAGCSGSDDDDGNDTSGDPVTASCEVGTFSLRGSVDGQAVSYDGEMDGHAWIQAGSQNTFDGMFMGGGTVHTEWQMLVADGVTTTVTGYVTFPSGGVRGGETLDSMSGSMTKNDDEVRFELTALSASVQCVTEPCPPDEVDGTIEGCVHWEPITF
jgi:hypothetical protein